jgi:hypothetical protein
MAPWLVVLICLASLFAIVAVAGVVAAFAFTSRVAAGRQEKALRVRAAEAQRDILVENQIEPGITYTNVKIKSEPWSIHVIKVDRSRSDLTFFTAHARDKVLGVSLLADQARAIPREFGRAIAGVNGDFYDRDNPTYAGDPRGLQILRGELISAPDTVCVWFDGQGNPHLDEVKGQFQVTWPDGKKTPFGLNQRRQARAAVLYTPMYGPSTRANGGREFVLEKEGDSPWLPLRTDVYRARVREVSSTGNTRLAPEIMVLSLAQDLVASVPAVEPGAVLEISTVTVPDLKGVQMAIAGGPAIIKNGKRFNLKSAPPDAARHYSEASKYQRHPRSAIGWSQSHVYFVTVDGRQPGLSTGMKLAELAEFMGELGCTEAMNLDGGKSAQMWMNGQIMNSPAQGEDTVANAIFVVRKAGEGGE